MRCDSIFGFTSECLKWNEDGKAAIMNRPKHLVDGDRAHNLELSRRVVLLLGLLLMAGCRPASESKLPELETPVQPTEKQRVLLVQSYHTGYEWTDSITRGVRMALPLNEVSLEVFYMDTKRHSDEKWKIQLGAEARRIVSDWNPAVVIAADDNAQAFFAKHYVGDERVSLVFCGVNNEPEDYGYPAKNITGVLERPHFTSCLEYFQRIMPSATRIAIVTDNSETSRGALRYMREIPEGMTLVSQQIPSTLDEWQVAIRECQAQADAIVVYNYHTLTVPEKITSVPASEVMEWTLKNSTLPLIGFLAFSMDEGALCGYAESGVEQGREAGKMARRILQGERPADIPIAIAVEGQSIVNLKTARRLGIVVPDDVIQTTDLVIRE